MRWRMGTQLRLLAVVHTCVCVGGGGGGSVVARVCASIRAGMRDLCGARRAQVHGGMGAWWGGWLSWIIGIDPHANFEAARSHVPGSRLVLAQSHSWNAWSHGLVGGAGASHAGAARR